MTATEYLRAWCWQRQTARIRLITPNRSRSAVKQRREAIAQLRAAGFSLPEIGRAMNRHHTTILHALRTAQAA